MISEAQLYIVKEQKKLKKIRRRQTGDPKIEVANHPLTKSIGGWM